MWTRSILDKEGGTGVNDCGDCRRKAGRDRETIIDEIPTDGNSAELGLVPGDSIVSLSVSTLSGNGDVDTTRVSTDCLGYDAIINAITNDKVVALTVKRLRRQPRINVRLQYPPDAGEEDVTIELCAGENLRRVMLTRGIKLNDGW